MTKKGDWTRKELKEDILSKYKAITIPVNIKTTGRNKVLDLSAVEKILRSARLISLTDCGCRERVKGCDRPLDVCLSIDDDAQQLIDKGEAKKVTLAVALKALERASDAGLVHMAYLEIGKAKPQIICSCCSCCCHSMSALTRFGFDDAVVSADKVAVQNDALCDDCGICVARCQFKARKMTHKKLSFNSSKCFGCGVCLASCPTSAISLVPR